MTTLNHVMSILSQAAIESGNATKQAAKLDGTRKGAYALYVQAAIVSDGTNMLKQASEALFQMIRTTGRVVDAEGKSRNIGAKPNKDGTGFVVPSAISAAKSYLLDAMERDIPLQDPDGSERAFTAIRKDVMAAKEAERRAALTGDEALRASALDLLGSLVESVKDADGAALAALAASIETLAVSALIDAETEQAEAIAAAA